MTEGGKEEREGERERDESIFLEGNGCTVLSYNPCFPVTRLHFAGNVEST